MVQINEVYNPYFIIGFCVTTYNKQKLVRKYSKKPLIQQEINHNISLIIWVTNLLFIIGEKFSRNELSMVKFFYPRNIVVRLLLSDAWLTFDKKISRLGFQQFFKHTTYVLFVFRILSHYSNSSPRLTSGIRLDNKFYGLQIFTRAMPCLIELRYLFYFKVKIIPKNIYDVLTPVALAHLIMGDGYAERYGLVIWTNSYTIQDVVKLINVFIIWYRLKSNIRKKQQNNKTEYMIYIRQSFMPLLKTIVDPYTHFSILYKINNIVNFTTWTKNFYYKFDSSMILFLIITTKLLSINIILLFILNFSLPRLSEILFLKLIL
uniref:hypothetical protein n=1 Tax=Drechslerella dactyloides TaxID=74499 RepID=UPI0022FD6A2E|nr:hypothetical protein PNX16_mgp044 [Drechslerella dactyloides]WAN89807.1 hypothetical protein [Drechslerella dactyloides]